MLSLSYTYFEHTKIINSDCSIYMLLFFLLFFAIRMPHSIPFNARNFFKYSLRRGVNKIQMAIFVVGFSFRAEALLHAIRSAFAEIMKPPLRPNEWQQATRVCLISSNAAIMIRAYKIIFYICSGNFSPFFCFLFRRNYFTHNTKKKKK